MHPKRKPTWPKRPSESMPKLLLNLRNVPQDEAVDVGALMSEHDIDCYETPPGPFGITAGGIWLRNPDDYERARELMDAYQAERARSAREAWQRARRSGEADTLLSIARHHPLRTLLIVAGTIFVLMVLFAPLVVFFRLVD